MTSVFTLMSFAVKIQLGTFENHQGGNVAEQRQRRDNDHDRHVGQCLAGQETTQNFDQAGNGKTELQVATPGSKPFLATERGADGKEAQGIDGGVRKHIQRVGDQTHGAADQASYQLSDEETGIDQEGCGQGSSFSLFVVLRA